MSSILRQFKGQTDGVHVMGINDWISTNGKQQGIRDDSLHTVSSDCTEDILKIKEETSEINTYIDVDN